VKLRFVGRHTTATSAQPRSEGACCLVPPPPASRTYEGLDALLDDGGVGHEARLELARDLFLILGGCRLVALLWARSHSHHRRNTHAVHTHTRRNNTRKTHLCDDGVVVQHLPRLHDAHDGGLDLGLAVLLDLLGLFVLGGGGGVCG
jgi:hypothetical protein